MTAEAHNHLPHMTSEELAARWRISRFTVSKTYRKLGLRPIVLGKRLLFPVEQVIDAERRFMAGASL
jgi:DNA-binding transcriptional regulator YhcF (GntR family)